MFLVSQVSGFVKNVDTRIFLDLGCHKCDENVNRCMLVPLIVCYQFIPVQQIDFLKFF